MSRGQGGCKNSLQKGDRFSVPLFTRVGARDAACGFGFGWAAVWLRFLLRVALAAVTAAETEFPLRSKWLPLHPAPIGQEGVVRAHEFRDRAGFLGRYQALWK